MPSPRVACQSTLSSWEKVVGSPRLVETPLEFGPRNCGQSSHDARAASAGSKMMASPVEKYPRDIVLLLLGTVIAAPLISEQVLHPSAEIPHPRGILCGSARQLCRQGSLGCPGEGIFFFLRCPGQQVRQVPQCIKVSIQCLVVERPR